MKLKRLQPVDLLLPRAGGIGGIVDAIRRRCHFKLGHLGDRLKLVLQRLRELAQAARKLSARCFGIFRALGARVGEFRAQLALEVLVLATERIEPGDYVGPAGGARQCTDPYQDDDKHDRDQGNAGRHSRYHRHRFHATSLRRQCEDGKGHKPVIAGIVSACDAGHSCFAMEIGGGPGDRRARIVVGQRCRDCAPAPRARKIESIEMHDEGVAAIAYGGRREQRRRLATFDPGQERGEPFPEGLSPEDPAHQVCLDQRRREKIRP